MNLQQILSFNVGGKRLQTTLDTIKKCSKLYNLALSHSNETDIFIDRDFKVFKQTLKLLRGYPMYSSVFNNNDLIHELIFWKHSFLDIEICNCINQSIKVYTKYDNNNHAYILSNIDFTNIESPQLGTHTFLINTPDVEHIKKFNTCYFVNTNVAGMLDIIDESTCVCNIVCAKGWDEHVWIEKDKIPIALYKLKLRMALNNAKFCVCPIG